MKSINKCLAVICLISASIATGFAQGKAKKDYALLTGKILNYKNDSISLADNGDMYFGRDIKVNPDGSFVDTIRFNKKMLLLGDNKNNMFSLYFENYENLHITYDINDDYPIPTFKGKYAKECAYMAERDLNNSKFFETEGEKFFSYKEKEFIAKNRELIDGYIAKAKKAGLKPNFLKMELRALEYMYYFNYEYYPDSHGYTVYGVEDYKPAIPLPNIKDDPNIDKNNPEDFLLSSYYQMLIRDYYEELILKNEDPKIYETAGVGEYGYKMMQGLSKIKLHEYVKNGLLFSVISESLGYSRNTDQLYNTFMKYSTDKKHRGMISDLYKELQKIKIGDPSPKFVNYENHKGGTSSLDDFKGKYVLIDVWATWCGPCVKEIPYLQKLEEKYHKKNIEFVSISVDDKSDHNKWRKMVTDKNLVGVQLIANNNLNSRFIQDYQVKSIPRFILIDPKGIIVDFNAPRPSDPRLDEVLAKLLK